jgi:tetratricopeptide (TPR) repeat protein
MAPIVTDDATLTAAPTDALPSDLATDSDAGVRRLHSAAMMADLLGVPAAAIRHWIRTGLLTVSHRSGSLEWLDFGQLVIGRRLAKLLALGLSLREIDAKLTRLAPGGGPAAAQAVDRIVADGRRLSIARDGRLLGAGGQLQLSFYTDSLGGSRSDEAADDGPMVVELTDRLDDDSPSASPRRSPRGNVVDEILDLADDLEAAGEYVEAAEALRAVLQAQGPSAEVNFMLAELLYRAGDLTAARERYYAAIELDTDHLRARTSLGCVLAELGDGELAVAALEGVLRQEPDYADAHWHMAGVLVSLGRDADARRHLRRFLTLAPDSPWADQARNRLACDR